jgi:hypothetical protein
LYRAILRELGPALSGRTVTIWVDETTLHVLLGGTRLKTLPSRLGITELARLAAAGARPAGPSPLPADGGTAIEVERIVNGVGLVSLAGKQLNVGYELAGQRVTLRMDGTQMAVLSHDGDLLRNPALAGTSGQQIAAPSGPPRSQPAGTIRRSGRRAAARIAAGLHHGRQAGS